MINDPDPTRAAEFYDFFVGLGCHSLGINIEEREGVNVPAYEVIHTQVVEFWAALTAAWEANPVIRLREVSRVMEFAAAVLQGRPLSGPMTGPWDPLPTIAHDGGVVVLSPELAGFTDQRFGDFTSGNVLRHGLDRLMGEVERRTPWLTEFWRGVDACREGCAYFEFCGGGHPANRYFEHEGRLDGTRTRYCTSAKIALLEGVVKHVRTHGR
ncbi:hypothetical protein [Streptomyces sp. NPDC021212]|uniref:hypothetical protein n=1 Tax=Streptomyces sp. NPDC021212 TaxID=3365118 RepID=UPI00379D8028